MIVEAVFIINDEHGVMDRIQKIEIASFACFVWYATSRTLLRVFDVEC